MHRVLRLVGAAALGLAALLLAGTMPSSASTYTLNFKGHVTSAGGTFDSQGFQAGDTVSGTLTIDPFNASVIKGGGNAFVTEFDQLAASSFTFHIANTTFHQDLSGSGDAVILSTAFGSRVLDFQAGGAAFSGTSALSLNFSIASGADALGSLAGLPGTAGDIIAYLGGLPLSALGGLAHSANGAFQVGLNPSDAVQFDLNLAATPIPATLPLFVTALLGTGLLGWRRARRGA